MTFRSDIDGMLSVQVNNLNTYNDALARYMRKRLEGFDIALSSLAPGVEPPPVDPEVPEVPGPTPIDPSQPYYTKQAVAIRYVAANTEYLLEVWIKITAIPSQAAALTVGYPVGNGNVRIFNANFSALNVWELKTLTFTPTTSGLATIIIAENIPKEPFR